MRVKTPPWLLVRETKGSREGGWVTEREGWVRERERGGWVRERERERERVG